MKTEFRSQKPEVRNRSVLTERTGFSLVEVTLAMAVMAVGLIAILGLIPQGVVSSRDAADNTMAATLTHDIFSAIRAQPFTSVDLGTIGSAYDFGFNNGPYDLRIASPAVTYSFFDQSGTNVLGTVPPVAQAQESYFRIELNIQPHSTLPVSIITATVCWPAKPGMTAFQNTTTFVTQVARYN